MASSLVGVDCRTTSIRVPSMEQLHHVSFIYDPLQRAGADGLEGKRLSTRNARLRSFGQRILEMREIEHGMHRSSSRQILLNQKCQKNQTATRNDWNRAEVTRKKMARGIPISSFFIWKRFAALCNTRCPWTPRSLEWAVVTVAQWCGVQQDRTRRIIQARGVGS